MCTRVCGRKGFRKLLAGRTMNSTYMAGGLRDMVWPTTQVNVSPTNGWSHPELRELHPNC